MAFTGEEKAFCVLEFAKSESVVSVQRAFRNKYRKQGPSDKTIHVWYRKFKETGCLCDRKRSGRPGPYAETVDRVRETFLRSPTKSTASASRELGISQPTVWRILRKRLCLKPYRLGLVQALTPADRISRFTFCIDVHERETLMSKLIFSDESTFHMCGTVNRHNLRIWGTGNPHSVVEHYRDSPKVNVFCAMSSSRVYGPFFFTEKTITGVVYLDMLQLWLMPQLEEHEDDFVFQQDGAPPHFLCDVREYLNTHLPHRWIGRASEDDVPLLKWPPRSPDLTPCDFFLWGYVKDQVFVQPMPRDLADLRERITRAINNIDSTMLSRIWQELDYRIDVCRVTKGSHIEHL